VNGRLHVGIAAGAGHREQVAAFHEERPLLREEDRVPLVHLHLERVALDLAEVRVERGIDRHRRRNPKLCAQAGLGVAVHVAKPGRRLARLPGCEGGGRDQLASAPILQAGEHDRRVAIEDVGSRGQVRPRDRDAQAADAPPEDHAHRHAVAALEANALERQAQFHVVAGRRDRAGALPDPVGSAVLARPRAGEDVALHARRVHEHVVRDLAGAEGIEREPHPVVVEEGIAAPDAGLDLAGLRVAAAERDVEVAVVVADPDVGLLRDAFARHGVVREPVAKRERRPRPRGLVQRAVQDGRRVDTGRDHLRRRAFRLGGRAGGNGRGGSGTRQEDRQQGDCANGH